MGEVHGLASLLIETNAYQPRRRPWPRTIGAASRKEETGFGGAHRFHAILSLLLASSRK